MEFTIVLQEEDQRSISEDVEASPQLKQMIRESMEAYKEDRSLTTSEIIKHCHPRISPNDCRKGGIESGEYFYILTYSMFYTSINNIFTIKKLVLL